MKMQKILNLHEDHDIREDLSDLHLREDEGEDLILS